MTHLRRQSFYALPSTHWALLAKPPFSVLDTLAAVDDAIDANADIAEAIFRTGVGSFGLAEEQQPDTTEGPTSEATPEATQNSQHTVKDSSPSAEPIKSKPAWQDQATSSDVDKARGTLRQLYRDWSSEGAPERAACYGPVLQALATEFTHIPDAQKGQIRVLVPGAGLGRLIFELACAGYEAQGNEISYHQLLASSFILNHTGPGTRFPLYPWALSFSNHTSRADQLQKVLVPDVHPGSALDESSRGKATHAFERLSMSAGDFCVAYKEDEHKNGFDAVATVFFIDTAPNLIAYIETVQSCLKSGGVWVNLGPLLWHFENNPPGASRNGEESAQDKDGLAGAKRGLGIAEAGSVELSDEEVVRLVERFGFAVERHEQAAPTGYVQNTRSMLINAYRPSFWIARKK